MTRVTWSGNDVIGADAVMTPEEVVRVPPTLDVQQAVVVAGVPPELNFPILQVLGWLVEIAALSQSGQPVPHLNVETSVASSKSTFAAVLPMANAVQYNTTLLIPLRDIDSLPACWQHHTYFYV